MEGGVPYAIDFLNPAPDAEITSVGQENFDWIVNAVAEMAVKMALERGESGEGVAVGRLSERAGLRRRLASGSRDGWRSGSEGRRRSRWMI